ncbi:hypothetical protein PybrP1_003238 [[Pythium] brassicae (nom. inval.)]|nr:hypothetical protein PybrP1_003238 [[Pythium] brassicae (nom. inval.)]
MAAIFAHLHSSPLVVRRRQGSEWRSLSASSATSGTTSAGLEAVELIDVKEERKLLVRCVRESQRRIAWHSEVADLHTFRKVLSFGCRALHFSGHGVPGKVIFEDKKGEAQFISQHELRDLLLAGGTASTASNDNDSDNNSDNSDSGDGVRAHEVERGWIALDHASPARPPPPVPVQLVFVSACHSESVAEAFVSVGVPHVVVVSKDDKVLDRKAMEFANAFYTALFAGHAVATAFAIGHVQADIATVPADAAAGRASSFKLLGAGDHSARLFRDVPAGAFVERSLPLPGNDCDAVAEVFVGRSLEVHSAYKSLVEGARLVSITGERGVGKTEVALQCAQYATERHLFKRIFFARFETDDDDGDDGKNEDNDAHSASPLVRKVAKSLGVAGDDGDDDADALANRVRAACADGNYLLVLDGCNRRTRQDPRFRSLVALLLRRASSLALLLTGDGKLGAMDGVGEKIVAVDRLPPADAALLFTLRAPRKIRAHEMGGSADLAVFGEHPVIRSLLGHPRTICAVSQFLETKDMELDQHEFLHYIIPSVNAGLSVKKYDHNTTSFPPYVLETLRASCQAHEAAAAAASSSSSPVQHSHMNHPHQHHGHHTHHASWTTGNRREVDASAPVRRMKGTASHSDVLLKSSLTHSQSERGSSTSVGASDGRPSSLVASYSESDLLGSAMSKSSQRQMCVLKIADTVKWTLPSKDGQLVWANAAVANAGAPDDAFTAAAVHALLALRSMPLDWIAPQISTYFASQLKQDAVTRPLSLRSIDFLSKSTLVWGTSAPPAALGGFVSLEMFAAFWHWFAPLTECIRYSRLWAFTQPRLLHGFLSKGACVNMLQRAPPGTFLLRFSETRQRCVVIAYVPDDGCVQFVPVTCQHARGWYVALQDDASGVTFPTLQDLILSVSVLKFLFPQTPKELAFHIL